MIAIVLMGSAAVLQAHDALPLTPVYWSGLLIILAISLYWNRKLSRSKAALQRSETFNRTTIDALSEQLCVLDEYGTILTVNLAWRRYAEDNPPAPPRNCVGMNYLDVCDAAVGINTEEARAFAARLRSVMRNDIETFTLEYPCNANDDERWFIARVRRFGGGDAPVRILVTHEEITKRRHAEARLLANQEKYQRLLDDLGGKFVVFSYDVEQDRFAYASEGVASVMQRSREAVVGRNWQQIVDWQPGTRRRIARVPARMLDGVSGHEEFEAEFRRADGSDATLHVTVHPVSDAQGRVRNVEGIAEDITARKRADAELRRAKELAEAANRAKSTFLANMSHELRTPLNAVLGFAQILQRDTTLGTDQQQHIETIKRSGEHLLGLINDVLDLAKIEAGSMELHNAPCRIGPFFDDLRRMFTVQAQTQGLQFRYRAAALPESVEIDEKRLGQICLNLLGNAVKFTERGSVTLEADHHEGTLVVVVSDTGIGIAPSKHSEIFEPFSQTGGTRYKQKGTGLGLTISRNLVVQMGGTLTLESDLGKGSRFTVRIPAPTVKTSRSLPTGPSPEGVAGYRRTDGSTAPCRILIVDDKQLNRALIRIFLEPLGFACTEAADGLEALEITTNAHFDMIFMDMMMPGMDGPEAARRLRDRPGSANKCIVALTARAYEEDRRECVEAGCVDFLIKPVDHSTLLRVLQQYLPLLWTAPETEPESDAAGIDAVWLEDLERAVVLGRLQPILVLLEAFRSRDARMSTTLQAWVRRYDFPRLLEWISHQKEHG